MGLRGCFMRKTGVMGRDRQRVGWKQQVKKDLYTVLWREDASDRLKRRLLEVFVKAENANPNYRKKYAWRCLLSSNSVTKSTWKSYDITLCAPAADLLCWITLDELRLPALPHLLVYEHNGTSHFGRGIGLFIYLLQLYWLWVGGREFRKMKWEICTNADRGDWRSRIM